MKRIYIEETTIITLEKHTCFSSFSDVAEESYTLCFRQEDSGQEVFNLNIDDLKSLRTMLNKMIMQENECRRLIQDYNELPTFTDK